MYPLGILPFAPSEDENNKQVACVSRDWLSHELTSAFQIRSDEESSDRSDVEHFMHPVGRVCSRLAEESEQLQPNFYKYCVIKQSYMYKCTV